MELDEAVSRRQMIKKVATKQRVAYAKRHGELPPIYGTKARYKFTNKEVSKTKDILDKQKKQRQEVRDLALLRKKGIAKTTAVVPAAPTQDRNASVTIHATPPTPGVIKRVNEPAPAHPLDVYKHAVDQYSRTGNNETFEIAKRASAAALARELMSLGDMTFKDGQDKFLSFRAARDRHNTRLAAIDSVHRVHNPKPKLVDRIKELFRKK